MWAPTSNEYSRRLAQSSQPQNTNDYDYDSDEQVVRVPRRTPVACQFCRGRKLKCDGRNICSNCVRRNLACSYVPV
ncbi:uncharacterized protein FOMMEDRAFT_76105 [Fomitiporia mediterranea MF3/22]|uniref:uncharacterized protein n=1 Tax=Fomitiporia mediterranea (strain MF3/22) TaxID=694068 RepID=UPI000440893B|nr:uncharacterized protein FOMMEDRAFT_76105 [Fomitiporia mediterranea MF3/22]EJD07109.1 hypothetical protein FOMMEDRAFT_76105 [Fomitiporia mediterranea MF3/22]